MTWKQTRRREEVDSDGEGTGRVVATEVTKTPNASAAVQLLQLHQSGQMLASKRQRVVAAPPPTPVSMAKLEAKTEAREEQRAEGLSALEQLGVVCGAMLEGGAGV